MRTQIPRTAVASATGKTTKRIRMRVVVRARARATRTKVSGTTQIATSGSERKPPARDVLGQRSLRTQMKQHRGRRGRTRSASAHSYEPAGGTRPPGPGRRGRSPSTSADATHARRPRPRSRASASSTKAIAAARTGDGGGPSTPAQGGAQPRRRAGPSAPRSRQSVATRASAVLSTPDISRRVTRQTIQMRSSVGPEDPCRRSAGTHRTGHRSALPGLDEVDARTRTEPHGEARGSQRRRAPATDDAADLREHERRPAPESRTPSLASCRPRGPARGRRGELRRALPRCAKYAQTTRRRRDDEVVERGRRLQHDDREGREGDGSERGLADARSPSRRAIPTIARHAASERERAGRAYVSGRRRSGSSTRRSGSPRPAVKTSIALVGHVRARTPPRAAASRARHAEGGRACVSGEALRNRERDDEQVSGA